MLKYPFEVGGSALGGRLISISRKMALRLQAAACGMKGREEQVSRAQQQIRHRWWSGGGSANVLVDASGG
jgi:hypothetical protein